MIMSMNRTLLLASFAVAAVGCAGAPEEIGESIAALGQTSCETAPRDEIATPAPCTCCVGGSRISSDASYGSALCPNQFLVGYGSFSGHAIGTAFWGEELPITELDCIQSHL